MPYNHKYIDLQDLSELQEIYNRFNGIYTEATYTTKTVKTHTKAKSEKLYIRIPTVD